MRVAEGPASPLLTEKPKHVAKSQRLATEALAFTLLAVLAIISIVTNVSVVFSGAEEFLPRAIVLYLFSGVVAPLCTAALSRGPAGALVYTVDTASSVFVAAAVQEIVQCSPAGTDVWGGVAFAHVILSLVIAVAFLLVGCLRLGHFVGNMPSPVLSGFLASLGFLLALQTLHLGYSALLLNAGITRRGPALAVSFASAVVLSCGIGFVELIPRAVLAMFVVNIGLSLMLGELRNVGERFRRGGSSAEVALVALTLGCTVVSSSMLEARAQLQQAHSRLRVLHLEGYLFFGTTHHLVDEALAFVLGGGAGEPPPRETAGLAVRCLVLDLGSVRSVDATAAAAVADLQRLCGPTVSLLFARLSPAARRVLGAAGVTLGARLFETLELALEAAEDMLLAVHAAPRKAALACLFEAAECPLAAERPPTPPPPPLRVSLGLARDEWDGHEPFNEDVHAYTAREDAYKYIDSDEREERRGDRILARRWAAYAYP